MIFCVEDDNGIRDLMIYTLNAAGFEALGLENGEALREAMKKQMPDLITLDIMLPDEDGIAILKRLRADAATQDIPVIMATAKGTEFDTVIGLDLGADDYLIKPFGMMEMLSRIKAVLRRVRPKETQQVLTVGKLVLDRTGHKVLADGKTVDLTLKEYELLSIFMNHLGRVYTREQLLQSIWGSDYIGETRTVDVHIATLRAKLLSCGDYIETIRGVGYRMEAKL